MKRKLYPILLLIFFTLSLSSCRGKTPEKEQDDSATEDSAANADSNSDFAKEINFEIDEQKIIEDQSFDVELNDWGKVRFVSCMPSDTAPTMDFTFYLMKDNVPIYKFPSIFENDNREFGLVEDITFVAFKDLDADGKSEVIVGSTYITGAGPQGVEPRDEVRIFQDKGDEFIYDAKYNEIINSHLSYDVKIEDVIESAAYEELASSSPAELYKEAKECPNAGNFEGKWFTGTHSSVSGNITITDQNKKGFRFSGFFQYYLHTGELEGEAVFVKDNAAVCKCSEDSFLKFVMVGDTLHVFESGELGFGMNVSAAGDYTQKQPVYENENILNEAYTESQLSEIKKMIGDDKTYEDYFKYGTEIGAVDYKDVKTKSGEKCRVVDCYVPTYPTYSMEYRVVMTESGKMYLKLKVDNNEDFYTNDSGYTEKEN